MASHFYTPFSQLKKKAGPRPSTKAGVQATEGAVSERTAAWSTPGPTGGSGFQRKTKTPRVKAHPASSGLT